MRIVWIQRGSLARSERIIKQGDETMPRLTDIEVDGIDMKDSWDFVDAYIVRCKIDGREATDEEVEAINEGEDRSIVYNAVCNEVYGEV